MIEIGTNYVSINNLTGIPVGTRIIITNHSPTWGMIEEAANQPSNDSLDGEIICSLPEVTATKLVVSDVEVWAKSLGSNPIKFNVQVQA